MANHPLLARFAGNIFWLGRYLERAENLARVLHINETYAREGSGAPDWTRVLDLYADTERFKADYDEISERTVLQFYMLDRDNPSSISHAIAAARENARTVRHLISTEMWTHLNILYGEMNQLTARDLRSSNLFKLGNDVVLGCQTFEGIAEGTFMRSEAACFYQSGKYIERADQTTRVLDLGYDRLAREEGDALTPVQWNVLLRSVSGYHAYRALHPRQSDPHDIAAFLLYDHEFPRAVTLCVERLTRSLRELEKRYDLRRRSAVEEARRKLEFILETGPGHDMTSRRLHAFLDEIQVSLGAVTSAIHGAYFGTRG